MSDPQQIQTVTSQTIDQTASAKIRVWDRFIRFFHWSLVVSFALAYWSAKAGKHELHALLGYFIVVLVLARLVWGFVGSRHARFSSFIHAPAEVLRYLKAIAAGHPRRFLGHNPAGGIMVIALLATLVFITFTGLTVLAVIDFDGPLLGILKPMTDQEAYTAWSSHAYAVNIILGMVGLHLLGVILATLQHKENLVVAMITGHKENGEDAGTSPSDIPDDDAAPVAAYRKLASENESI